LNIIGASHGTIYAESVKRAKNLSFLNFQKTEILKLMKKTTGPAMRLKGVICVVSTPHFPKSKHWMEAAALSNHCFLVDKNLWHFC